MSKLKLQLKLTSQNRLVDRIDELNALNIQLKETGEYDLRIEVLKKLIPLSREYLDTATVNANIKRFRENKINEYKAELVEIQKDKNLLESLVSDPKNRSRSLSTVPGDPKLNTLSPEQALRNALNAAVWPYNGYGRVTYGNTLVPNPKRAPNTSFTPPEPLRVSVINGNVVYTRRQEGGRRRKTRKVRK
jgi:hypothetical protein